MSRERLEQELREAGYTDEQIANYVAYEERQTACIDRCECPECGATLKRELDSRQAGDTFGGGSWFNYTCTGCGYRIDRAEQAN